MFFLCDIILTFNTAVYIKGSLIVDRKRIAFEYLKLWFWLDLLSSFPYTEFFDLMTHNDENSEEN